MAKQLLMGNEAMAYAALEAGVRVAAGYPGTPSSEIIETIARLRESGVAQGVHVEWSANEKAALELLGGAALAGARCLFTCKQMGLNVASDPLMCLNYVGVCGGLVLIVADDPGPISSQTEQDTRRFAAFAKVPVLDPATPEQAYEMVKAAFDLSERIKAPVIVRPTTRVDHASAFFDVPDQTCARPMPDGGFERNPAKWVIFPRRSYAAHGDINARLPQVANMFSEESPWTSFNPVEEYGSAPVEVPAQASQGGAHQQPTARHAAPRTLALGIVAGGVSASYVREALRIVADRAEEAGVELPACRFMQVGTPYPFPEQAFDRFAEGLTDILVIEELDHVLEEELLRYAGYIHAAYTVHGRLTGEARDRGENDVDDIAARIAAFLDPYAEIKLDVADAKEGAGVFDTVGSDGSEEWLGTVEYRYDLPVRPPVLCPGCPHRGSFYAVKRALGKTPAVLCGDIGCYTLGNAKPLDAVDTCLCMGAGVTMAQGFAVADPGKKAIAFIGDSTFFASGMPGLANAAYNGHDITVVVLDNATTAMTGSQPHPGTGVTLMGENRPPISIEAVLNANGFARVYRANPLDKDAAIVAAKAAIAYEGPSAVIFASPCVQLFKPGEPVSVDSAACIGCKKCIADLGCPAISFDALARGPKSGERGQAVVDPGQCNGCGLCAQVCSVEAIVFASGRRSVASLAAEGSVEAAAAAQVASAGAPSASGVLYQVDTWREAAESAGILGGIAGVAGGSAVAPSAETPDDEGFEGEDVSEVETEPGADSSSEPEVEPYFEPEAELEAEPELEAEGELEGEGEAEAETEDEPEAEAEPESEDEIGSEAEPEPEIQPGAEDESQPGVEDDFEIIVVGGASERGAGTRAEDMDDFEVIVVGASDEPEVDDAAAADADSEDPFEVVEVGNAGESAEPENQDGVPGDLEALEDEEAPQASEAQEAPESSEAPESPEALEASEAPEAPESPEASEFSGASEPDQDIVSQDEIDGSDVVGKAEGQIGNDTPDVVQNIEAQDGIDALDADQGAEAQDELEAPDATAAFVPVEDTPHHAAAHAPSTFQDAYVDDADDEEERPPVYNGYVGNEVFLDIPIDDEEFVHEDWYSWKRGGHRD